MNIIKQAYDLKSGSRLFQTPKSKAVVKTEAKTSLSQIPGSKNSRLLSRFSKKAQGGGEYTSCFTEIVKSEANSDHQEHISAYDRSANQYHNTEQPSPLSCLPVKGFFGRRYLLLRYKWRSCDLPCDQYVVIMRCMREFPVVRYVILPLRLWVQSIHLIYNEAQSTFFVLHAKICKVVDIFAFTDPFTIIRG